MKPTGESSCGIDLLGEGLNGNESVRVNLMDQFDASSALHPKHETDIRSDQGSIEAQPPRVVLGALPNGQGQSTNRVVTKLYRNSNLQRIKQELEAKLNEL